MSIPTGISVPGGELAYRIGDIAPDPKTLVVVNCAGRTRSIMGAESLRRAGIPNKVVALRNGTMGWELAGLRCERGRTERFAPGTPKTAALALQRAQASPSSPACGVIGADRPRRASRTTRPHALCAGRARPGGIPRRPPPGQRQRAGRAAGAGDRPLGRRARRAHRAGGRHRRARPHGRRLAAPDGPSRRVRGRGRPGRDPHHRHATPAGAGLAATAPTIDVPGLVALLDSGDGTVVIDLARSIDFRDGHIPGALWGVRTRLDALAPQLAAARHVVLTSPDGVLARLAVAEVQGADQAPRCAVLDGGTDAWRAFGRPLVQGPHHAAGRGLHRLLSARLRPQLGRRGGDARLSDLGDRAGEPDQARRHGGVRCWRGN